MAILLSVYLLEGPLNWSSLGRAGARAALAVMVVFSLLQVLPYLYPGDSALTGQGRHFALNMFDARVECRMEARALLPDGGSRSWDLRVPAPVRTRCDPVIVWNRVRRLCRSLEGDAAHARLSLRFEARRSSDADFTLLTDREDVCGTPLEYSIWKPLDWVADGRPRP
jgi:hypothetical protein